jgi:hypothetical protein
MRLSRKSFKIFLSKNWENIVNIAVFVVIYAFLLSYFKPSLILLDTHISGGDTGSFNYPLVYLKDYLLPHGKLIGWSPGWYAGIPMFQYYFSFPFLLAVLLSYLISLNVAFKIITILGTFLLPLATFFSMKLMKFNFPMPIIATILIFPFLFNQGNSMWGGNIPSTLAGEFSFSLSLAFTVLFFGLIYKGMQEKKFIVQNSILFALISLTHVYTMLFAGISSLFLIIKKDRKESVQNFKYLFKVYLISLFIIGFWAIPLLEKMQYRTPFDYIWTIGDIKEIFPDIILPVCALSALGFYMGLKKRDERIFFIIFSIIIALILYKFAIFLKLTDIRFIPFVQLFLAFIAAYFIFNFIEKKRAKWLLVVLILILVLFWVNKNTTYISFWIEWNYSGYESKQSWSQFNAINTYLASLPEGRIVHEFSNVHDKFGTVRSFESFPLFAKKPVLEGLFIESGLNAQFVFWIQSEISETPTCPLPRTSCSSFNLENGTKHLKLFNVNYIVATSDKLKNAIRNNSEYTFLKSFDEIEIYKINNTGKYVELAKYEPILAENKNWKKLSYDWFKNPDLIDMPIVFSNENDGMFKSVLQDENLSKLDKIPVDQNCFIDENVTNDEVRIKTSCIGKPLLVKISYYPNWKVEGASKVYHVTPAFMLIFPEKENVRLFYENTILDTVGEVFSIIGIIICILYFFSKKFSKFLDAI